jgi:hypothetical protein
VYDVSEEQGVCQGVGSESVSGQSCMVLTKSADVTNEEKKLEEV